MQIIQKKSSFTLIELLISVAILTVMVTFGVSSFSGFQTRKAFVLDGENIVEAIRNTQNRSITQEGGYAWNIKFTNSATEGSYFEIYSGTYATSAVSLRKTLSGKSSFTNPAVGFSKTISFAVITGMPTVSDSLTIKRNVGGSEVMIISVNSIGKISYSIESSLVGYWPMDEGTGVATMDASKNGNTGSLTNGPTWITGKMGKALQFDGNDDLVLISTVTLGNENWTVGAWIKTTSQGTVFSNNNSGPVSNKMGVSNGKNNYKNYDGVWNDNYGISIINNDDWHFLTWVNFDNNTMTLYVDGISENSGFGSYTSNGGPINSIGRDWTTSLYGTIDDVRIYNRALSATEVKDLYNSY